MRDVVRIYDVAYDCIFKKEYSYSETINFLLENQLINHQSEVQEIVYVLIQYADVKSKLSSSLIRRLLFFALAVILPFTQVHQAIAMPIGVLLGCIFIIAIPIFISIYKYRNIEKQLKNFRSHLQSTYNEYTQNNNL